MNALNFNLHFEEPVLATQAQSGEENSATTHEFIPGSMVRGALVSRYRRERKLDEAALVKDADALRLFFSGAVRFLNAYPQHAVSGARMLPQPLSWFADKPHAHEDDIRLYDFAIAPNPEIEAKHLSAPFCYACVEHEAEDEDEQHSADVSLIANLHAPKHQVNVHNTSNSRNRKAEGKSNVYRYDALASGQTFVGAIVADEATDLAMLKNLLGAELLLGGSHTAGYGRVSVSLSADAINTNWQEYAPDAPSSQEIIVTLLSDAIIRDARGYISDDLGETIRAALQLLETPKTKRAYKSVRLVGGFNRTAGLPLPQTWALQAGSVFVYDATAFARTDLRAYEAHGLGERTTEGFGRFAVDWHTHAQLQKHPLTERATAPSEFTLARDSQELAQRMAQRQLHALLDRRLTEAVNGAGLSDNRLPNNAQLSRVRTAVRQALVSDNLSEVITLLDDMKAAKQQFENARVNGQSMLTWIRDRAQNPHGIQQQLSIADDQIPNVANERAAINRFAIEYTSRLIDGVMHRAMKLNQDKEDRA